MRLLLDTQVVLWQVLAPDRLGVEALAAIERSEAAVVSVVAFVEIGVKVRIGKLPMPAGLRELVTDERVLGLRPEHGLALATLPLHHKDPFDRLLVAQALAEGLTIVTSDVQIAKYDVPVIDARA